MLNLGYYIETLERLTKKKVILKESEKRLVYRGVNKDTKTFTPNPKGANYEQGFSVTPDKKIARRYSSGKILTGYIIPSAKIKKHVDKEGKIKYLFNQEDIDQTKQEGYDGIEFINKDDEHEILIFNPKVIVQENNIINAS